MSNRIWPPEGSSPDQPVDPAVSPQHAGPLTLRERLINALKQVYDPEIPINIVDLGLIYEINISPSPDTEGWSLVHVVMTLTTPNCPEAESIPRRVKEVLLKVHEVAGVEVDLTWQPAWDKSMMTEDARLVLGLD